MLNSDAIDLGSRRKLLKRFGDEELNDRENVDICAEIITSPDHQNGLRRGSN
jgi:hypothetical protein